MAKTKLTEERKQIILDAIGQGNTKETAAALAGVSESTLYNWIARGKDEEPPNFEGKTLKQLRTMAKQMDIKNRNKMNMKQLQDAITAASCIYSDFTDAMKMAEARGLQQHVRNVTTAGLEDWRASAWYLERRDPDNWAKRDRLQADINHSGGIKTEHEESYKVEVEHRLTQDPQLQDLYMQIWERQQLASIDE